MIGAITVCLGCYMCSPVCCALRVPFYSPGLLVITDVVAVVVAAAGVVVVVTYSCVTASSSSAVGRTICHLRLSSMTLAQTPVPACRVRSKCPVDVQMLLNLKSNTSKKSMFTQFF